MPAQRRRDTLELSDLEQALSAVQLITSAARELSPQLAQQLERALPTVASALVFTAEAMPHRADWYQVIHVRGTELPDDLRTVAVEIREAAGARSQKARQALLRDLTETSPDAVSPASLNQARREAAHRQRLLRTPSYDYETLRGLRGEPTVRATRTAVSRMRAKNQLFTVSATVGRTVVIPAFLLTDACEPRPELQPLLEPLLTAGLGPWQLWTWLTSPTGLLSGQVPEAVAAEPATAERAAVAARRFAAQASE